MMVMLMMINASLEMLMLVNAFPNCFADILFIWEAGDTNDGVIVQS